MNDGGTCHEIGEMNFHWCVTEECSLHSIAKQEKTRYHHYISHVNVTGNRVAVKPLYCRNNVTNTNRYHQSVRHTRLTKG